VERDSFIIGPEELILVTGATGFIGRSVVRKLLERGYRKLRAFARPSSDLCPLQAVIAGYADTTQVDLLRGNLLSRKDCAAAADGAAAIIHLAAGTGDKSFPNVFSNSVVATRNLLEATMATGILQRFVHVSSFAVYQTRNKPGRLLDESCPVERHSHLRGDAYCFAKVKQEEIVQAYAGKFGIPCVVVRPGSVYGPGKKAITGRVGLGTFGVFLHLGGSNRIPFTYVDNCADAIVLAALTRGVEGEVFNIVDDDLPTSRSFLRLYKRNVEHFRSLYVPHFLSYSLCYLWEKYSAWSQGQLPPSFNRSRWYSEWKKTRYSNESLKTGLGWTPKVTMEEGLARYFEGCREGRHYA